VGYTLKRFDGFYNKDFSFVDQIEYPAVTEYAAAVAQFRTGNIHTYAVRQEEVVGLKKEVPDVSMYAGGFSSEGNKLIFGWKTAALRDERVRQAFSLSYDRDLWIEVWNNASKFEELGLPIERRWFGGFPSISDTYDGWRLEPRDAKSLGPSAKYYQHDVAEAKKLLAAAGYPNGMTLVSSRVAGTQYGANFHKGVEVREGMNAEAGFKFTPNIIDYQTEFIPNYRDTKGEFEGVSYKSGPPATSSDPVGQHSFFYYSKAGVSFYGFDAAGKGDHSGDPHVDQTIEKAQQELDNEKRKSLMLDLDRYLAQKMYAINGLGGASGFSLVWPAVQNYRVWRGGGSNTTRVENAYWWIDDTKAPLKKA
jgi:ABC-type transport system substrate-binding protein